MFLFVTQMDFLKRFFHFLGVIYLYLLIAFYLEIFKVRVSMMMPAHHLEPFRTVQK